MLKTAILRLYQLISLPIGIYIIMDSKNIHQSYRVSLFRKLRLGLRMFLNARRIQTGSNYKVHMAMGLKILETPPDVPGDVIECGTWKGGSAANLSIFCRIAGRKLRIYDSFEGLPEEVPVPEGLTEEEMNEFRLKHYVKGDFMGTLEEVKENIRRYGAIECCEFIKGWFEDTLPKLDSPVLLAYLDVDLRESLHTCVKNIWPHLVEGGYVFTDECVGVHYVALFFSEKWWHDNLNTKPPGLIGAGTGLPLGNYYIGMWDERDNHPSQASSSGGYTRKGMKGYWDYWPEGQQ